MKLSVESVLAFWNREKPDKKKPPRGKGQGRLNELEEEGKMITTKKKQEDQGEDDCLTKEATVIVKNINLCIGTFQKLF